ncbi:hypothetical protein A3I99_00870 [Candidatus Kaiserbacteria bacterium RIFCSPLOWO2_02_FULL_45_11b]|uniref:Uncharacterized protein n=1 Tax=Candidatus Kaiserbacteria bacterium RIFCSPLOWO2_12_FULL_45_26 TaxID=1798525 RepID=A0A1F6FG46_9BACT|nr:MAG: hypothetical protein A2929_00205 [Candidatus Kaiserbacteria bacterium RIFCSPLOWO2_01_FULL_45_25]OGG84319.1 MAG: hypothetical protein A3I99_00870 [Candidatus Kaiserbacteria bacterium RIFCSPLOWO2_02_FULL_45_11b]OGG84825.1 MAG: hypothetical protein A3G90_01965 [Candidatus Kaiserbacteria bacterium RIFCSPLOWO2_12_FULL_45_26]
MSQTRRVFISYAHVPNLGNVLQATSLGFAQMDVEIDFPIRNGDDLTKALNIGCERDGIQGKKIVVLNWQFFE